MPFQIDDGTSVQTVRATAVQAMGRMFYREYTDSPRGCQTAPCAGCLQQVALLIEAHRLRLAYDLEAGVATDLVE